MRDATQCRVAELLPAILHSQLGRSAIQMWDATGFLFTETHADISILLQLPFSCGGLEAH